MPTGIYLHVYIQSKAIKGKSVFYWVISLQQIIPLTPWKVIKVILIYVLIKYAKNTHAVSVFAQYIGILITDFTFLCFVISFLCSLHKNRFNSKNLCGTIPEMKMALWRLFQYGYEEFIGILCLQQFSKKEPILCLVKMLGIVPREKKKMELKVRPVNL